MVEYLDNKGLRNIVCTCLPLLLAIFVRFLPHRVLSRSSIRLMVSIGRFITGLFRIYPRIGFTCGFYGTTLVFSRVVRCCCILIGLDTVCVVVLAVVRVPKCTAWAVVPKLFAVALDLHFPSPRLRRATWGALVVLFVRVAQTRSATSTASWSGSRFHAVVESCSDGDTCRVNLDSNLPPVFGSRIGIRVRGIDAAELRGARCPLERCLAVDARDALRVLVTGRNTTLDDCGRDKYFRLLCDIRVANEDVGQRLMADGYAVAYGGSGPRHDWCAPPEHRDTSALAKRARRCGGS